MIKLPTMIVDHDCWPAQLEMYFVTMSNKYYRCMTSRSLFHWRNGSETIVENFDFFFIYSWSCLCHVIGQVFFLYVYSIHHGTGSVQNRLAHSIFHSPFFRIVSVCKKRVSSPINVYIDIFYSPSIISKLIFCLAVACTLHDIAMFKRSICFQLIWFDASGAEKKQPFSQFLPRMYGIFHRKKRRKMEKKRMWTFHISYYSVKWLVPDWISDTCFVHHSVSTSNTSHIGTCRMKDKFGQGSY